MNLNDIRSLFAKGTEIYLTRDVWSEDEEEIIGTETLRIDNVNLLWGNESFGAMPVSSGSVTIANNCVCIDTSTAMPVEVLRAWKSYVAEYATKNLLECEVNPKLIGKMTTYEIIQAYAINDPVEFTDNIRKLMRKYDVKA